MTTHKPETKRPVTFLSTLLLLLVFLVLPGQAALAQSDGTLTLENNTGQTICEFYISSSTDSDWGQNQLDGDQLAPGQEATWNLDVGLYDLQTVDCSGNILDETYGFDIRRGDQRVYSVGDEDVEEYEEEPTPNAVDEEEIPANTSNEPEVETVSGDDMAMEDLVNLVAQDLDAYWSGVFEAENGRYQRPDVYLFDKNSLRTGCGGISADMGPLYCSLDHTIYLPLYFMEEVRSAIGDFSVATVIAHEWGHAVQAMFGVETQYSIVQELRADCFAGSYGDYIENDSDLITLEEGDLDEGATLLYEIGDPGSVEWFDPRAHGQPDQRSDAYDLGLSGYEGCWGIDA